MKSLSWLLLGMLVASPVFAADDVTSSVSSVSAEDMVTRVAGQIPALMKLVTAIAYVLGIYFIYHSLMKFKEFGEQRTMMSSQHHMKEPMTYMIIGAMLLYLPTTIQAGMSTFWSDPNPYGYAQEQDQWSQFIGNAILVVQLFGTIAFIRGLVILSHTGSQQGGGQGALGKGVTHVVGGLFCVNIYQFVQAILWTLGIQT
tara:strand:- start:902 stop:1501 length:600 start_codon:yes stop_codon:yes gene_type:complete